MICYCIGTVDSIYAIDVRLYLHSFPIKLLKDEKQHRIDKQSSKILYTVRKQLDYTLENQQTYLIGTLTLSMVIVIFKITSFEIVTTLCRLVT